MDIAVDISVDARMLGSGIGRYLARTLPYVFESMPDVRFGLLGDQDAIDRIIPRPGNVGVVPCTIPHYSLAEHIALPRLIPPGTRLHWTPHFNAPLFGRTPQVTTIHDALFLAHPEWFGGGARSVAVRFLYHRAVRRSARVLTGSVFTREELRRTLGADCSRVVVTPYGIEEEFSECRPEPVPVSARYVFTVGNVKPHKNLGVLLEAFEQAGDRWDAHLVVAGQAQGFITHDPDALRRMESLRGRVHYLGAVSDDLLKNLYRNALMAVFPSLYEGFGYGPLEAMAHRCPVLVSDIPVAREVCGRAAALFDPHDAASLAEAMLALGNDPAGREGLVSRGSDRVRQFSARATGERTARVLREVLTGA